MESIRINKKKYKISEKIKGRLIYQVVSKKGKELPCICKKRLSVEGKLRVVMNLYKKLFVKNENIQY